ncbi:MAG: conserved rane protein of unknown function [Actinomycetia bacterium]|nr:conserved rane protein of unknown function [Actinomycetes bacterium]
MTPVRRLWHEASGPGWGPLPELLLALTLVTGLVDAVSILALGRVFVANMTGNVVFAGFAIAGAPGFSLSASAFALAGFLIGAALGGRLTSRVGHDRALHLRAATAAEVGLVVVALVIAATSGDPAASHGTLDLTTLHLTAGNAGPGSAPVAYFGTAVTDALALVLAIATGIQNSVARKLAVPDLTTTVLTMTLTGIGADLRSGRRGNLSLARRLLAVAIMLGGGVLGAWLVLQVSATAAVAVAAGLLLVAAACAALAARTPAPWRSAGPAPARTAVASPDLSSAGAVDHELHRRVGQGVGGGASGHDGGGDE